MALRSRACRSPRVVSRPPGSTPTELHGLFLEQAAIANWNAYRLMPLIRRMEACSGYKEYGCVTMVQYLSLVCGITGVAARERIRVAHALVQLPRITDAMAKGKLSYSKVRAVTRVATYETDEEWLQKALNLTVEELEVMVVRSERGAPTNRRLLTRALSQNMTRMIVDLPAEEMAVVTQALEALRRKAGEKLTAPQALVHMAGASLSREPQSISTAERYTVVVHTDKTGGAWVETESGRALLQPELVERLLCDCTMQMARERGDGPFVLSRRVRTLPRLTRRAIEVRDHGRCRVPGCHRRLWLEAHHLEPWCRGGKHTGENLILLCTQHHQLCHHGILVVDRDPATGKLLFLAADGWVLGEGGEMGRGELLSVEIQEAEQAAAAEDERLALVHDPEEGPRGNVSAETFLHRTRACQQPFPKVTLTSCIREIATPSTV